MPGTGHSLMVMVDANGDKQWGRKRKLFCFYGGRLLIGSRLNIESAYVKGVGNVRGRLVQPLLVVRSRERIIKPCGLVCCVAILCPVASVALLVARCSLPRLSSRLCCHRRYLNLACLHASPRSQHLSHCLLTLPSYPIPRGLRYCHRHHLHGELLVCGARPRLRGVPPLFYPPHHVHDHPKASAICAFAFAAIAMLSARLGWP